MNPLNIPVLVLILSLALLIGSSRLGMLFQRFRAGDEDSRADLSVISSATLALLGLIIGFSFSMAISRYDQRKSLEEEEANAIGTEYLRTDLLPAADAARIKPLLLQYLDQRIAFYTAYTRRDAEQLAAPTDRLQAQLWREVQTSAASHTIPTTSLAVSGMNDVLNTQGYTQASWNNRIPVAAWLLLAIIAVFSNLLTGFGARRTKSKLFLVLPFLVATSFFLIADIESPRGGMIRVQPENLHALRQSLQRP